MKTLPQSWPFPTKRGEDQRAAQEPKSYRKGQDRRSREPESPCLRRPPKPRSDAKLDVSTFDALF